MSQPPPHDPYGQPQQPQPPPQPQGDPYASHQGYSQPMYPGYPQYQQQPPRQPLDIGQLLFIAAWVVLGLISFKYLYSLAQDEAPLGTSDFADRFFAGLSDLAVGMFYAGVLLFLSSWLKRPQQSS